MASIRYSIVQRVLGVQLSNPRFPGFMMGAYKTVINTYVAEHAVLYNFDISCPPDNPLVRINSACFTGDVFGDLRCDCNEQLLSAADMLKTEPGLIIYHMHHEGRGLGLTAKMQTYLEMQNNHESTYDSMNRMVGSNDLRNYGSAMLILTDLNIRKLRLISNSPLKSAALTENGFEVDEIVPVQSSRQDVQGYYKDKISIQGHTIQIKESVAGNYIEFDTKGK